MNLFHGTSYTALTEIAHNGLVPRGARRSNFEHSAPSNNNAVYLTDTYPLYFAAGCASSHGEAALGAVIEIDTDLLDETKFNADEDVLEQTGSVDFPPSLSKIERVLFCRDLLNKERFDFRESLAAMGTCAYFGIIPPMAITRVAIIDFSKQAPLAVASLDATITVMNYMFCSISHRQMTAWVLGDELPEPTGDDIQSKIAKMERQLGIMPGYTSASRDGIDVVSGHELIEYISFRS